MKLKNNEHNQFNNFSFSCICPGIDHEFCDNVVKVKVAVDPQGDSRVDLQTSLTML